MNDQWQMLSNLRFQCSELRAHGDFFGAIPLQQKVLEILESWNRATVDIANAHNHLSVLHLHTGDYSNAEFHAREALARAKGNDIKGHEQLGCYHMVLARVLALQGRPEEAIREGEQAIVEWSIFHNPPDDFLKCRMNELERIKLGIPETP